MDEIQSEMFISASKGPKVSDKIAKIINLQISEEMEKEKLEKLTVKHKLPENCTGMLVPRVDEYIWSKLSVRSKKQDLSVMKLQGLLLQAQSAIINTVEKMSSKNFD